jgi:hypothetical protein
MGSVEVVGRERANLARVPISSSLRAFVTDGSLRGSVREAVATTAPLPPERWMETFAAIYPNRSLGDLCLLGSHHAGMYDVSRLPIIGQLTGDTMASDTLTQTADVGDQLRSGVRYLEMRLIEDNGNIYPYHTPPAFEGRALGAWGPELGVLLGDLKAFLHDYPDEIVVIELKDASGPDGIYQTILDRFLSFFQSDDLLHHADAPAVHSLPLKDLVRQKSLVLIATGGDADNQSRPTGLPKRTLARQDLEVLSVYDSDTWLGKSDYEDAETQDPASLDHESDYHKRVSYALSGVEDEGHGQGLVKMQLVVRKVPVRRPSIVAHARILSEHAAARTDDQVPRWRSANATVSATTDQTFPNVYFVDLAHQDVSFRASQRVNRCLRSRDTTPLEGSLR